IARTILWHEWSVCCGRAGADLRGCGSLPRPPLPPARAPLDRRATPAWAAAPTWAARATGPCSAPWCGASPRPTRDASRCLTLRRPGAARRLRWSWRGGVSTCTSTAPPRSALLAASGTKVWTSCTSTPTTSGGASTLRPGGRRRAGGCVGPAAFHLNALMEREGDPVGDSNDVPLAVLAFFRAPLEVTLHTGFVWSVEKPPVGPKGGVDPARLCALLRDRMAPHWDFEICGLARRFRPRGAVWREPPTREGRGILNRVTILQAACCHSQPGILNRVTLLQAGGMLPPTAREACPGSSSHVGSP
ncbi:unnamed protein product, partial [Prorocentrum cordatum]